MKQTGGTILEAAFVDPAYSYPPAEGQGRNAIELQATAHLLHKVDPVKDDEGSLSSQSISNSSIVSADLSVTKAQAKAESDLRKRKVKVSQTEREETVTYRGFSFFKCCKSAESHVIVGKEYERKEPTQDEIDQARAKAATMVPQMKDKLALKEQRQQENIKRRARREKLERELAERDKYNRVAEGILIYRLNTATRTITLLSGPSSNTDVDNLMYEMVVAHASPSNDKSRRGICLVGKDGSRATITACEQRTAIAWLEAIDMMLSRKNTSVSDLKYIFYYIMVSKQILTSGMYCSNNNNRRLKNHTSI